MLTALGRGLRDVPGEEEIEILRADPMRFFAGPMHSNRRDSKVESIGLLFREGHGLQFQSQAMFACLPLLFDLGPDFFAAFPTEFLLPQLAIVDLQDDATT